MHRRLWRSLAFVLVLTFGLLAGSTVSTQDRAYAVAPALIIPAASAALPLSVVSAHVGGGLSLISTGGALASAGITAAAAFAANWAVKALFSWGDDAPEAFGDPPPVQTGPSAPTGTQCGSPFFHHSTNATSQSWNTGPVGIPVNASSSTACDGNTTWDTTRPRIVDGSKNSFTTGWNYYNEWGCQSGATGHGPTQNVTSNTATVRMVYGSQNEADLAHSSYVRNGSGSGCVLGDALVWGRTISSVHGVLWEWHYGAWPAPQSSGDPGTTPLTVKPTTTCVDAASVVQQLVGEHRAVTRGEPAPQVLSFPACPAGSTVQSRSAPITRDSDGEVQGDVVTGVIGSDPGVWSPPAVPAVYPDCSGGVCVMTLTQTDPAGHTSTCGPGTCLSYAEVVKTWPQVGTSAPTVARQAPDGVSYQCRFGPYPVAVAECQVIPGVGLPAAEVEAGNCMGGIGWNPTTWVTVPVKCALQWAFQPSPGAVTAAVQPVTATWGASAPGQYLDAMGGVVGSLGALGDNAAGCGGPTVTFNTGLLRGDYKPLAACPGDIMHNASKVVRVLATIGLYLGAAALAARILASSLGLQLSGFGRGDVA